MNNYSIFAKLCFADQWGGITSTDTTADPVAPVSATPAPATPATPATVTVSSPAPAIAVGDIITFGEYYQFDSKTKDPIDWQVLEVVGSKALLISHKILDVKEFNDSTMSPLTRRSHSPWEFSSLRKWLNTKFLKTAFNFKERKLIQKTKLRNEGQEGYVFYTVDKIFVLSSIDTDKYLPKDCDRVAVPTDYALERQQAAVAYAEAETHKVQSTRFDANYWWLRTERRVGYSYASLCSMECCDGRGYIFTSCAYRKAPPNCQPYGSFLGVRPAMWIDLDKK